MFWRPLKLSSSEDLDILTLLIATKISSSSYVVYLTDLVTIWSESLSHQEIRKRGYEEGTSIDPSSEEQLAILLEKIDQALNGSPGTTIKLRVVNERKVTDARNLILKLHVDLPKGLTALEWPVRLSVGPATLMANTMTIPLLGVYNQSLRDLDTLSQYLKQKDHIIERLLDKLEEQGIDLGQVFPHVLGKHRGKLDREVALKKVRGLAKFEPEFWENNQKQDITKKNAGLLIQGLFQDKNTKAISFESTNYLDGKDNWWESINQTTIDLILGGFPSGENLQELKLKQTKSQQINDNIPEIDGPRTLQKQEILENSFGKIHPVVSTKTEELNGSDNHDETDSGTLEEIDSGKESDDAFSFLPLHRKKSKEPVERNLKSELQPPPQNFGYSSIDDEILTGLPSNYIDPKKPRGKLMVIKGRKKFSTPPEESSKDNPAESKTQKINIMSSTSPQIFTSQKRSNLGIIKGTKNKAAIPKLSSLDPMENDQSNIEKQQARMEEDKITSKDVSQVTKNMPKENIVIKEDPLEKANRKRAELRKEIDLKMANQTSIKKKRRF